MRCIICDSNKTKFNRATIAEFIRERCEIKESHTRSIFCLECTFVFFERRLSEIEVQKLYANYRGNDYNKLRLKVESSYIDYIRMFDDKYSAYWVGRTNEILEEVRKINQMDAVDVLDFGGDGMIPARIIPGANISIDDPAHGTTADYDSKYDLIFASEVFEHLSNPSFHISALSKKLKPTGFLIIDVPMEYTGAIKQEWDKQCFENQGSLISMHEHINHFSIESMKTLVAKNNLKLISIKITPLNFLIAICGV